MIEHLGEKVAAVTGAAGRIGLAFTDRFVAEGMKVATADIDEAALVQEAARIVNTASGAGLVTNDFIGVYCATEHAVVGLSESPWPEVHRLGVGVSCLCPNSSGSGGRRRNGVGVEVSAREPDIGNLTRHVECHAGRAPGIPESWRHQLWGEVMSETRRKYDPEFKAGAVRVVLETGNPIANRGSLH